MEQGPESILTGTVIRWGEPGKCDITSLKSSDAQQMEARVNSVCEYLRYIYKIQEVKY